MKATVAGSGAAAREVENLPTRTAPQRADQNQPLSAIREMAWNIWWSRWLDKWYRWVKEPREGVAFSRHCISVRESYKKKTGRTPVHHRTDLGVYGAAISGSITRMVFHFPVRKRR